MNHMNQSMKVTTQDCLRPGCAIAVDIEGLSIAIFNMDGKFFAMNNQCGHRGGPLAEGSIDGNVINCPWHGFAFDITTGNCATNPAIKQQTYQVRLEGNDVWLEIPA